MVRVEVYVITKEGTLLHKYNILDMKEDSRDQLIGGFLTALNTFAKEIGFPQGVSLIRSGSLEARFSAGEYVFSVLIIDYSMPLGLMTEPILSGLANEITEQFEEKYRDPLVRGQKVHIFRSDDFADFRTLINNLLDKYGKETFELYQKLILIEALYAKVPQKWIFPLMEQVSEGTNVLDQLNTIPESYSMQLKKAVQKVNLESKPLWNIFAIPMFEL